MEFGVFRKHDRRHVDLSALTAAATQQPLALPSRAEPKYSSALRLRPHLRQLPNYR